VGPAWRDLTDLEGGGMIWTKKFWLGLAAAALPALTGCLPLSMGIFTPMPIMPWVSERMEEKYAFKNDHRVPVMPPIRERFPVAHLRRSAR